MDTNGIFQDTDTKLQETGHEKFQKIILCIVIFAFEYILISNVNFIKKLYLYYPFSN